MAGNVTSVAAAIARTASPTAQLTQATAERALVAGGSLSAGNIGAVGGQSLPVPEAPEVRQIDLAQIAERLNQMKQTLSHEHALAFGADYPAEFWIQAPLDGKPATCGNGSHVCFRVGSTDEVDAFHKAGLESGGTCGGEPGLRPEYHPSYYAAFLIDPDGHKIEALYYTEKI